MAAGDKTFNGRTGEYIRYVVGLILAGIIAYFTTIGTLNQAVTEVREREDNHFSEVLRRLDVLQGDIRELRDRR